MTHESSPLFISLQVSQASTIHRTSTMAHKKSPKRRQLTRHYHPLLFSLLASVALNTGSAFNTLPIHSASAMSTADTSYSGTGSASKPLSLSAAEEGNSNENSQPSQNTEGALPQLREASNDSSIPTIKLGESISLEAMGPVIINADGTTRRIDNWDQMTEKEQEVAWRRISKRNEQRRKALMEQQQKEMEGKEEEQQL
ncbi:hypothetical protein ACHAXR_001255 [Thalassiosira sp. AJA248-18]